MPVIMGVPMVVRVPMIVIVGVTMIMRMVVVMRVIVAVAVIVAVGMIVAVIMRMGMVAGARGAAGRLGLDRTGRGCGIGRERCAGIAVGRQGNMRHPEMAGHADRGRHAARLERAGRQPPLILDDRGTRAMPPPTVVERDQRGCRLAKADRFGGFGQR